ncbi:hypothetical protein JYU02_01530 [bacterium AH-315-P15]|nr:hypothetical protein [bacterium AH-315-P15]
MTDPQNPEAPPDTPNFALSDERAEKQPEEPAPKPVPEPGKRWVLARDIAVFQGKLALDALRDLVLSPVSIVAALAGVFLRPENPGHYFYDLMRWGRRSDHFINLFSAGQDKSERDEFTSVDDLVETLEKVVVNEHERGGMTAEAKAHIDKTLDQLEEAIAPDRRRLGWRIKRAAVSLRKEVRKEVRKVRDQISSRRRGGPGAG